MKKKNMLQVLSLILCMVFVIALPVSAKENEPSDKEPVYYETEEGRYVNDFDEYLAQLNCGEIKPFDSIIINYESNITPFDLSEPSEKCSNIFGHKWDDWGGWEEVSRVHFPKPPCIVNMERWRFCTRTYCSAYQIETDTVWVNICSH